MTGSHLGHLPSSVQSAAEAEFSPAGPVDEVTSIRLQRNVEAYFGVVPGAAHHLALLDARGAWYALRAMGAWDPTQPITFFGLVRHVVRTMMPGPAPDPDVEAWLDAGPPDDPGLADAWVRIRSCRIGHDGHSAAAGSSRAAQVPDHVRRMDEIVRGWPAEHFDDFVLAYASVGRILELRAEHQPLPPIQ